MHELGGGFFRWVRFRRKQGESQGLPHPPVSLVLSLALAGQAAGVLLEHSTLSPGRAGEPHLTYGPGRAPPYAENLSILLYF